jgi:predicted transglutaminase-like cysteine proteinase
MDRFVPHLDANVAGLLIAALLFAPPAIAADSALAGAEVVVTNATAETGAVCPDDKPIGVVLPTTGLVFTLPPDSSATVEAGCVPGTPPTPTRPAAPHLFGMAALPIGNVASQEKWESARFGSLAEHPGAWAEMLDQADKVSGGNPLEMVNLWVNWHMAYREDVGGDQWTRAGPALERGFGDCEDFALTKMALLAALGVPWDEMFLVLVRDRRNTQHAILAVRQAGRLYVLDNRTDKIQAAEEIDEYTPILGLSGSFAWTYGRQIN